MAEQTRLQQQQMQQQQVMMQQMMVALTANRNYTQASPSFQGSQDSGVSTHRPIASTVSPAQAVKLLASQLPNFGGIDEEDIDVWILKVESVVEIHEVSKEITLVATSKLVKLARRWFDLTTATVN